MKRAFFLCMAWPFLSAAQFAPAAGQPGTTAIKKDSSIIISWAAGCHVTRGLQDISNASSGYASVGDSSQAIGPADGVNVVSLGDGGSAILTFQRPVKDLAGPDFCVFENSFDPGFLELAFVEVSSDGVNFTRFPATCNVQNTVQIGPFDPNSDPVKINNLAGKYIGGYGVPFDLQELQGTAGLNTSAITHVKIIDVIGCIQSQYATKDNNNNIINDPWATPFASGGFDLDAVGVIHEVPAGLEERNHITGVSVFPTVSAAVVFLINYSAQSLAWRLFDMAGVELSSGTANAAKEIISIDEFKQGMYFLEIKTASSAMTIKVIKAG